MDTHYTHMLAVPKLGSTQLYVISLYTVALQFPFTVMKGPEPVPVRQSSCTKKQGLQSGTNDMSRTDLWPQPLWTPPG